MQQSFSQLKVLFSEAESFEAMKRLPSLEIFDSRVIEFMNNLSIEIRKDKECRLFPDIVTFGFFCRKANVETLKKQYYEEYRIGRGLSFHVAPSNVPINFAYSLVIGLLAGNSAIVRTSTKDFEQTRIVCKLIRDVVKRTQSVIGQYIAIVRYERSNEINDYFSSICDVRVVWGGDNTVREIRKSEIPSRCVELAFADRYSLCVLNAKAVCDIDDFVSVAQDFYNDTYLYDQNACSSPRLMYWIGSKEEVSLARKMFWDAIYDNIGKKYQIEPVVVVDKLMTDYRIAIECPKVIIERDKDNLFHRILLNDLDVDVTKYACPGGSFLEYESADISDLLPVITKKVQTITYLGMNPKEIVEWIITNGLSGVDRIVPMGKSSDLTLTWDGYNLIETMSRKIFCQ